MSSWCSVVFRVCETVEHTRQLHWSIVVGRRRWCCACAMCVYRIAHCVALMEATTIAQSTNNVMICPRLIVTGVANFWYWFATVRFMQQAKARISEGLNHLGTIVKKGLKLFLITVAVGIWMQLKYWIILCSCEHWTVTNDVVNYSYYYTIFNSIDRDEMSKQWVFQYIRSLRIFESCAHARKWGNVYADESESPNRVSGGTIDQFDRIPSFAHISYALMSIKCVQVIYRTSAKSTIRYVYVIYLLCSVISKWTTEWVSLYMWIEIMSIDSQVVENKWASNHNKHNVTNIEDAGTSERPIYTSSTLIGVIQFHYGIFDYVVSVVISYNNQSSSSADIFVFINFPLLFSYCVCLPQLAFYKEWKKQ